MDPLTWISHGLSAWDHWWRVILSVIVDNVSFFVNLEKSTGAEGRWVVDTGDLSSQVVLLFSEEEWVSNDVTLESTCEEDFDRSGGYDILWFQIWKHGPVFEGGTSDPIGFLVNTGSLGLHIGRCWVFFVVWGVWIFTLEIAFGDIVVFLGTSDFTKESNILCTSIFGLKLYEWFLQPIKLCLSKTDSSPLVNECVLEEVWNSADCINWSWVTFFIRRWSGKQLFHYSDVVNHLFTDIFVVFHLANLEELIHLMGFGMLKQIWNFLKLFESLVWVVKDQFLEDFLQVGEQILAVTAFDTREQCF